MKHGLASPLEDPCLELLLQAMIGRTAAEAGDHDAVSFTLDPAANAPELTGRKPELSRPICGGNKPTLNLSQHSQPILLLHA